MKCDERGRGDKRRGETRREKQIYKLLNSELINKLNTREREKYLEKREQKLKKDKKFTYIER